MPSRRGPPLPDERDETISRLEERLWLYRMTIYDLVPDQLREPLDAAHWCKTRDDLHEWKAWAVGWLLDRAEPQQTAGGSLRAACPLCHGGSSAQGAFGYSMPIGLERHLSGSHGSALCSVLGAALDEAREAATRVRKPGEPVFAGLLFHQLPPWKRPASAQAAPTSANVVELPPPVLRPRR